MGKEKIQMAVQSQRLSVPGAGTHEISMTGMQKMAVKMWAPMLAMGLMIVLIALLVGIWNSGTVAAYFTGSKLDRETAAVGSAFVHNKVLLESTSTWLPGFKFLGIGLLLSGITFLLATILGTLRVAGLNLQKTLGKEPQGMEPPATANVFPMAMMFGLLILAIQFVVSVWLAGVTAGYWNHVIKTELDAATAGSSLLADLATIRATGAWLEPFRFTGIAFLLAGIGLALATIVQVLRGQRTC
jgi:hypothetical protein